MSNRKKLEITKSNELLQQGREVIAGFTQSMMKKPEQFALGRFPVYLSSGEGAEVTDVDGNRFIDYVCGLGANSLGHGCKDIVKSISNTLTESGILHSLPAPLEIDAAKGLIDIIPGAQMVRFFKTGADANSAAIRLARFTTGREKIITVGYNGWHDHFMYDTPGIPKAIQDLTVRLPLFTPADDQPALDKIESQKDETAAVILSVPYTRELNREFLVSLKDLCKENGIIFILDEIVTGFRLALGGAQEYYDIQADLVTLSKGIAAGMPLSAVVGSKQLISQMEKLQVSTTFGGELLSMAACISAVKVYKQGVYFDHIRQLGKSLKDGVNTLSEQLGTPLKVVGYDAIPMFLFDKNPAVHAKYAEEFVAKMAEQGVLMRRDVNFISLAHTQEHIEKTLNAVSQALQEMKESGVFDKQTEESGIA